MVKVINIFFVNFVIQRAVKTVKMNRLYLQQFPRYWLIMLFYIMLSTPVQSQLTGIYINEILASNLAADYDATTSDYPDWIEIFNSSASLVNIGGYYLTTDPENVKMWKIPDGFTVPANGYVAFWADESNVTNHTNFELSKEGGFIGLYSSTGIVSDSFSYGFQIRDISFGRDSKDMNTLVYFTKTTKGSINSMVSYSLISKVPFMSLRGGFYNGKQTVILSTDVPGSQVHYTTNGSEPDSASSVYSVPIVIAKTTALRARTFKEGALPSLTVTQTYLIDEPINLPVISIVTDSANFFNNTIGIYVTGTNGIKGDCDPTIRNLNQDWERPVNVELYEKDGSPGFNQEAGIKIYGGCSRTRFPQKSLALYARNSYGKGSFDYQLFPEKSIYHFDSFVLRSSADDQVSTFMKDALAQHIAIGDMDLDIQAYRPAVVFFDGVYWGIHDIREKINEHYLENNYHLEKKTVNILQGNRSISYGSSDGYSGLISFITSSIMETAANYKYVKSQIEIDQFIDYEILHIYLAERDWPGNNIKYWNSSTPSHTKWRWICYDLDQTFIRTNANILEEATATNGPSWPNPPWATLMLRSLLKNQEFKNRFIQRYAFYICTTFSPERLENIVNKYRETLEPEIPRHIIRWGGKLDPDFHESWTISPTFNSLTQWENNVNNIITFTKNRPSVALSQIMNKFGLKGMAQLKISANFDVAGEILLYERKVPKPVFSGNLYTEVPVILRASSNPGYRFLYWELQGNVSKTETAAEISLTFTGNQEVKAVYEKVESIRPVVIINEINYDSPHDFKSGDWVEIYNKQNDPIDLSGWRLKDKNPENSYELPQGTLIPSLGYLIICEDISLFTSKYHYLINYRGNSGFGFNDKDEVIKLMDKDNNLVDSVHYTNKFPWPEVANGDGHSIILKDPDLDNDLAENWTISNKSTPGGRNDDITGIESDPDTEIRSNEIEQNYPNPCSSNTTINYLINKGGNVSIRVFDINATEISSLADRYIEPGSYSIILNTGSLINGVYFYEMKVDNKFVDLKKFIVIH
jgi:hypothetical protein